MNWPWIEYFTVLAETGSFTKAAERLHITQQSLSAAVAKLEQELGTELVIRKIPVELTYAGQVFLRYAREFSARNEEMLREFSDILQEHRGVLKVGVGFTRGQITMPGAISLFQRAYPNMTVELVERDNDELHRLVESGDVDLAVASYERVPAGIVLEEYYREEPVLLITKELFRSLYGDEAEEVRRALSAGDYGALARCPLILGLASSTGGHITRSILREAGIDRPLIKASSNNVQTRLRLCLKGSGACLVASDMARASLSPAELDLLEQIPLGAEGAHPIYFAYPEKAHSWSMIREFIRLAREEKALTE